MRTVKVHPESTINFTKNAKFWTEMTNLYKRCYPKHSFKQMAEHLKLSETNARRYYYGIHHVNGEAIRWAKGYTQIRLGASVTI
jgi:hypothetical protein